MAIGFELSHVMMSTAFVFLPDSLDLSGVGFLEGFSKHSDDSLAFYVTDENLTSRTTKLIGSCSGITPNDNRDVRRDSEWIHINNQTGQVTVQNTTGPNVDVTCVSYSMKEFKKCDASSFTAQNYGPHLEALREAIRAKPTRKKKFTGSLLHLLDLVLIAFHRCRFLFKYSSTATHFEDSIVTMRWTLKTIEEEEGGTMSLKIRNVFASKIFDVIIGTIVLHFVLKHERQIFFHTNVAIETIIHGLRDLLEILMGSPIGLKLNHAFNMTLGTFFFYHIALWRVFIQFTRPLLRSAMYFLLFPAVLGLSFQVAIFEDLLKLCTFHVYCIYVYAARLYGVQIHALISLWRLFIGHKYNPLRQRVDSYQYNRHQLFIGTLGFTILLFLLPTTLLYYVVFTAFRLGLKLLNFVLARLRALLGYLPLYVAILWALNSPSVAGAVILSVAPQERGQPFTLHVSLRALPLWTCLKTVRPKTVAVSPPPEITSGNILRTVFVGALL